MGKTLIIAEKPSVAADIAKALGGFKQDASKDFYESDSYLVSSAVGHLLQLAVPEEYEVVRGKWTFAHLPHIPPTFTLKPIEKNEARLKVLAAAQGGFQIGRELAPIEPCGVGVADQARVG